MSEPHAEKRVQGLEEGFMQYPIGPVLEVEVMARFVSHLCLLKQICCLQLLVSRVALDSQLVHVCDLHHKPLNKNVIALIAVVPVGWLRPVWALSQ